MNNLISALKTKFATSALAETTNEETKPCTKCKKIKPLNEYWKTKTPLGYRSQCKECESQKAKEYYATHKENFAAYHQEHKEYRSSYYKERKEAICLYRQSHKLEKAAADRRYRQKHKAELSEKKRQYRLRNKEKILAHKKEYYEKNKIYILDKNREWFENNQERNRENHRKYIKNHPEQIRKSSRKYFQKQYGTAKGKLSITMSAGIAGSLKNGSKAGRKWESLVDFTVDQLRAHLEKQFEPWMTWENYGRNGWHIDHKIPIAAFYFEKPEDIDFKRCWSLMNLQPMEAHENMAKRDKVDNPFQPSLAIAI